MIHAPEFCRGDLLHPAYQAVAWTSHERVVGPPKETRVHSPIREVMRRPRTALQG